MPRIVENDGDEDADDQVQTQEEHVEIEGEQTQTQHEPEIEVVEEGDEPQGDTRLAQSDDDEPQHQRKRETAAERRQRAKEAKIRDKRELDFQRRELKRLEQTVHELTQGQVVTRVTELDNRLASAQAEVAQWEKVKAMAISKHEGADAVAADNFLNAARDKYNQAAWDKQQVITTAQQQPTPQQREVPFAGLMNEFLENNTWYDPKGVDEDSLIVKAIDNAVAQKYKPTDPAYWRELQKRVDARFGNNDRPQSRNDSDEDDVDAPVVTRKRQGPPVGGSNRSNSSGGGGSATQIRLSPERVQAMKDAGLWEDPKVRARMAKTYSEYDRNNPQRRA